MSLLLKNCNAFLTVNDSFSYKENLYIGIENSIIDYIGESAPIKEYSLTKDMKNMFIIPGLINTHTHSAMVLFRGIGSDLPLKEWLSVVTEVEKRLREEDIKSGTELAIMEMLQSGTTSFSDMYLIPSVVPPIIEESGIKANISRCVMCFDPDQDPREYEPILETVELFKQYNGAFSDRLRFDFSMHAEYTINERIASYYSALCHEYGAGMQIHLAETERETRECIEKYGMTQTAWFYKNGTFNSPVSCAHCVYLSDSDMEILKENGASVVHNPSSNMKLASGFAPISKMIDKGLTVGLGTDGAASNNNLNMLEEMHLASLIHNGYNKDASIMKPETVLKMATINGAKIQRRENTGSIEVGKKADLVALMRSNPHSRPLLNPLALLTYTLGEEDVYMTMVDGKILYENGEFLTLDKERIYYEVEKSISYLFGTL